MATIMCASVCLTAVETFQKSVEDSASGLLPTLTCFKVKLAFLSVKTLCSISHRWFVNPKMRILLLFALHLPSCYSKAFFSMEHKNRYFEECSLSLKTYIYQDQIDRYKSL